MPKRRINDENKKIDEKHKQDQLAKQLANKNKLLIDSVCKNKLFSTRVNTGKLISNFSNIHFSEMQVRIIADSIEKFDEYNEVGSSLAVELSCMKHSIKDASELTELVRSVSSPDVILCLDNMVRANALFGNFVHQVLSIVSIRGKDLVDPMVKCYLPYSSNCSLANNLLDWVWDAHNQDKSEGNGAYMKEVLETFYRLTDVLKAAAPNAEIVNSLDFELSYSLGATIREGRFTRENIGDISYFISNFDSIKRGVHDHYLIENPEKYTISTIIDLYKNIGKKKEKPLAVVVQPTSDAIYLLGTRFERPGNPEDSAFGANREMIDSFRKTYDVRVLEVRSPSLMLELLRRMRNNYGPIDFLMIGGHGTPTSINLGYDPELHEARAARNYELRIDDSHIFKRIGINLDPNAQIVLLSCSNGAKRKNGNIAMAISKELKGREVFAAPTVCGREKFKFNKDGRIVDITYLKKKHQFAPDETGVNISFLKFLNGKEVHY